jgi:hypothetical protein
MDAFTLLCWELADEVAGVPVEQRLDLIAQEGLPPPLHEAFNALLNGCYERLRK